MIQRRRFVVKPGFQLRYTGIILLSVFVVSVLCIGTTYYLSMSMLGEKLANVYPQGRLIVTLRQINSMIIYRLVFLAPLVILIGILLSHRIAGPAYRIEKTLREIGKGNLDVYIKLRKYDELVGIANAVNDMTFDLKKIIGQKNKRDEA